MSDLAEAESPVPSLLRDRSGVQRVTNIELFFDLVYPGRLGRSAYHLIHPVMVAGIIVSAAADEKVLSDPGQSASVDVSSVSLEHNACQHIFDHAGASSSGGGAGGAAESLVHSRDRAVPARRALHTT